MAAPSEEQVEEEKVKVKDDYYATLNVSRTVSHSRELPEPPDSLIKKSYLKTLPLWRKSTHPEPRECIRVVQAVFYFLIITDVRLEIKSSPRIASFRTQGPSI